MAINVNRIYKSVLSILNKEQRGYLTPDEFNKLAKQAQLNLLEIAFAEYNKFLNLDTFGRINSGYADLPERIKEKIDVFYKTSTLSNNKLPSDIYKLIDLNIINKTVSLEEIDKNELTYLLSSPLTKPSKDFPVYYKTTTTGGETSVVVSPTISDTISIDYIKIPTTPRFGYTINATYGTNIYDSNTYVADGLIKGVHTNGIITSGNSGLFDSTQTITVGTTTGVTTSGSGTGSVIVLTISSGAITNVNVTSVGSGFEQGDTITISNTLSWVGADDIVLTLRAEDIYSLTTQGSVDFELHPAEENLLILSILAMAGVTIKDQALVTLTSQALQSQATLKAQ